MKISTTLIIVCLCVGFFTRLDAQDPHFSQFYNAPLQLNPALTGMSNGAVRAIANYRTQWGSVATPFNTMAVSADFAMLSQYMGNDVLGGGIMVMKDQAGSSELKNTQVQVSLSFNKSLNRRGNQFLSFGSQLGYSQQGLNTTKLTFDNQIDGDALNTNLGTGEQLTFDQFSYVDFTFGAGWTYAPDRFNSYYVGASIAHLNEPQVSFFDNEDELLYRKTTIYAGAEFRVNHAMSIVPRGIFLKQGAAQELNVGALVKIYMGRLNDAADDVALYFGTMHRFKDAQVLVARFDYGVFGVSMSYDINISKLANASNGRGAFEMALMYKGSLFGQQGRGLKAVRCPSF